MPSHGSLQQAVKVRPGRGEKQGKEAEKKNLFSDSLPSQVEKYLESIFSLFTFNFYKLNNKMQSRTSGV